MWPYGARVGGAHLGVGRDGPRHLPVGGEVPGSVLLLLKLGQARSTVELSVLVLRAVPEPEYCLTDI